MIMVAEEAVNIAPVCIAASHHVPVTSHKQDQLLSLSRLEYWGIQNLLILNH